MIKKELYLRKLIKEEVKKILKENIEDHWNWDMIEDFMYNFIRNDDVWNDKITQAWSEEYPGGDSDRISEDDGFIENYIIDNYDDIVSDIMKNPIAKRKFMELN